MNTNTVRLTAFLVADARASMSVPPRLQYLQVADTQQLPSKEWHPAINVKGMMVWCAREHLQSDCLPTLINVHGTLHHGLTLDALALVPEHEHERVHERCSWVDFFQPETRLSQQDRDALTAGYEMLKENLERGDGRYALELVDREEFTFSELRRAYEAVLNQMLDRSNFRKRVDRMVDAGTVREIPGRMRKTLTRPASLYRYVG